MTAKHTEGKLRARSDGALICGARMIGRAHLLGNGHTREEREANAARLALCWNEHDQLVKDRDELAELLENVLRFATGSDRWDPDVKDAGALLTRIKEASQ